MGDAPTQPPPDPRLAHAEARLYASPLAVFAEVRKKLALELRAGGAPEAAKELAARKKPSRAAWALNQVARHDPGELSAFLQATADVREAEAKAKRERSMPALAEAGRALQVAIAKLVARCAKAVEADGAKMTTELERALGRALHAVPFARPSDIEALTRGTLTTELEEPQDAALFGGEDAGPLAGGATPAEPAAPARVGRREEPDGKRHAHTDAAEAKAALAKKRVEEEQRAAAAAEAARLSREADKREAEAFRADERAKRAERDAEEAMRYAKEVEERAAAARDEARLASVAAKEARALADRHGKGASR